MEEEVRLLLCRKRFDDAFERLLDLYQDKVYRLAISILRDPARAEEATQDTFLKLWRALPSYNGSATVSTWLYSIARNTCLSSLRSWKLRRTVPYPEKEGHVAAESRESQIEVTELLEKLPRDQREALTLFYLQGNRIEEIAAMLGKPEGTVKSLLHRARRRMAEMMED